jgi:flavin-binding protein dodecin
VGPTLIAFWGLGRMWVHCFPGGCMSSIAKVIELIAESDKSWDDAAKNALKEAAKTVKNIKSIWMDNMSAEVQNNKIVSYRANVKVTFVLEGH